MSRAFTGVTTDNLQLSSSLITAVPITISAWVYLTAVGAVPRAIIHIRNVASGQGFNQFALVMNANETLSANTGEAANSSSSTSTGTIAAATWTHVGMVSSTTSSRFAWLAGVEAGESAILRTPSGINSVQIGVQNHSSGTLVNPWDGRIAEVGVWSAALSDDEMTALSKGFSPLLIRPGSLVYYWPLIGQASTEVELINSGGLTVTGTSAADHPRVYMPQSGRFTRLPAPVAGGSSKPKFYHHRQSQGMAA